MTLPCYEATPVDLKKLDAALAKRSLAFVIAVYHEPQPLAEGGEGEVEIFRAPECGPCEDPEFPKESVRLFEPTQITVLSWENHPCKGCVVNGKWYPCCPI
jgi:hypothetical protein